VTATTPAEVTTSVPATPAPTATAPATFPAGKFDFEDLKQILKANKDIKSVDQVIPKLPPSYRKYYTVSYNSRSRQGGTPESPRVIAFGAPIAGQQEYPYASGVYRSTRSDNLIIAFKSDPSQKIGMVPDEDDLEVFEWLPAKRAWVAHDVIFPNRASARTDLTDEERYNVSIDNPTECRGCHRYPDMRPNWEAYPRWPGMFGSNVGPYDSAEEKTDFLEEKAALKLFAEKIKDLPRFQMLEPYPYKKDEYPNPGPVSYTGSETVNINMTVKVGTLNFKRVQRMIEESPYYPKLKFAVYAGMAGCANFPSFLADPLRARITLNYDQLFTETNEAMSLPQFHFTLFKSSFDREVRAITNMRYLFEGAFDEKLDHWFMNVDRNQFRANAVGGQISSDVGSELASKFYQHPQYQQFKLNVYADTQPEAACSVLRDLSLREQLGR
jgi:hypothetical protein